MTTDQRLRAASLSLFLGPALLVAGTGITPQSSADPGPYLADLAANETRFAVGALLFAVGHLLLGPAVLTVTRIAATRVTLVAGAAVAWGALVFGCLGFTRLLEVAVATTVGPQNGAQALERFNEMPFALVLILSGVTGMVLGGLALFIGLARAGHAPWWLLVSFVTGQAGVMTGGDGTPIGLAGSALLGLTFAALGWFVLASHAVAGQAGEPALQR